VKELSQVYGEIREVNSRKRRREILKELMETLAVLFVLLVMIAAGKTGGILFLLFIVVECAIVIVHEERSREDEVTEEFERALRKGYPDLADRFDYRNVTF
jgi:hypothetical protein